jgi:outer membrane protein assembly factor BamB
VLIRSHAAALLLILVITSAPVGGRAGRAQSAGAWTQWGGPKRDFVLEPRPLAEAWPVEGPPVLWSRPLGTGHSSIVVDDGRLFTMYRVGNGRAKQGPWDAEEIVVALDAASGKTIWEHEYPSRREDFSFGAGPHSTPLVVGDRVFTIGTNQQMFALDKRTGRVLWSHDFIKEFGSPELLLRPNVKTGYGCSPIAFRDTVICSVGGPGQSVIAFRQSDGAVVWKSGDFLTAAAAPILIDVGAPGSASRQPQLVFLAGGTVTGMDPATGRVLWSHPHDPGNDLNCATPLWGPDNVLFVSSAYKAGSRAIALRFDAGITQPEQLWFTNRVRFMFLSAVRVGDHVYGTTGDFGPAFLTALNIKTGESAWQHRGFGRASLLQVGDMTIVMDEDGDLALARLSPAGVTILAQTKLFETTTWTVPTLVGTTLYARDREKIVALDLGDGKPGARVRPGSDPLESDPGLTLTPTPGFPSPNTSFAGTWRLDASASRINDAAGLAGLIGAGAPPTLHITQPANGTLIVESAINAGEARFYRPGRETTTPAGGGTITMKASWSGASLIADGTHVTGSAAVARVKEMFSVSPDGNVLTIEVTRTADAGESSSRFHYTRTTDLGPCEKWPTPCKRF